MSRTSLWVFWIFLLVLPLINLITARPWFWKISSNYLVSMIRFVFVITGLGSRSCVEYEAARFAVMGLYESLRLALQRTKSSVRSTCICAGNLEDGGVNGSWVLRLLWRKLTPNHVVDSTVEAIRRDRSLVVTPRSLYLQAFLYIYSFLFWIFENNGLEPLLRFS